MKKLVARICHPGSHGVSTSLGLLFLRVFPAGLMIAGHGWGKLTGFADRSDSFPDPLGIGSLGSLSLAVFAEVVCSLAVILGLATRLAAIPLLTTMIVAAVIVHADDPWARKEFALVYACCFLPLIFTGAGRFSIDQKIGR